MSDKFEWKSLKNHGTISKKMLSIPASWVATLLNYLNLSYTQMTSSLDFDYEKGTISRY